MSSVPRHSIHLTSTALWVVVGCLMAFTGTLVASVALGAGVRAFETLMLLFVIGAVGMQLSLIVLYLASRKKP